MNRSKWLNRLELSQSTDKIWLHRFLYEHCSSRFGHFHFIFLYSLPETGSHCTFHWTPHPPNKVPRFFCRSGVDMMLTSDLNLWLIEVRQHVGTTVEVFFHPKSVEFRTTFHLRMISWQVCWFRIRVFYWVEVDRSFPRNSYGIGHYIKIYHIIHPCLSIYRISYRPYHIFARN